MTQKIAMLARVPAVVLALGLLAATPIQAQTSEPTPPASTPESTTTMTDTPDTAPQMTAETFQDWVVRCATGQGAKLCEMTQELNDAKSGQRVLAIGIKPSTTAKGGGEATMVAPLGLKLAPGVMLKIDDAEPINLPFDLCLPQGCVVRSQFDAQQIEALENAKTIGIDMTAPDGTTLGVKLSPNGFQNAWKRLQDIAKE